ncbi:heparinase II/III family protein [Candidatus Sumerlaeota bacterium]|nr:heparinase II/III family protein [Candidatus Sumerlaeota bacterium]
MDGKNATPIVPYVLVPGQGWAQTADVTIDEGAMVTFGPQPIGGSWSWSGGGTSGDSREQTITPASSVVATAVFTNEDGMQSQQEFHVTVIPAMDIEDIGQEGFKFWNGLEATDDSGVALAPAGTHVFFSVERADAKGLKRFNLTEWHGLRFEAFNASSEPVEITATLEMNPQEYSLLQKTSAPVLISGEGWHQVLLPWTSFDYWRGAPGNLAAIEKIGLQADKAIQLRNIKLTKGAVLHIDTPVKSKPVEANQTAEYVLTITNCTEQPQGVVLSRKVSGWEGMDTAIEPASFTLDSGEAKQAVVRVTMPERIPQGGRESQIIEIIPNGDGERGEIIELITVRKMESPYLMFQQSGWDAIRAKVERHEWARRQANDYIERAERWNVPQSQGRDFVFHTQEEQNVMAAAIAWQLTREIKYAEKVATYLRRYSDPDTGYPRTRKGMHQSAPQEGHFTRHTVMAYDTARDSGVFTPEDEAQIEKSLRLFLDYADGYGKCGDAGNWLEFNINAAAFASLALQDLERFERFLHGAGGLIPLLVNGTLDDGWWYEGSTPYNVLLARDMTYIALAAQPWGYDLLNTKFPATYSYNIGLRCFEFERFQRMGFERWGPRTKNSVCVKNLWDAIVGFPDYRGVIFGVNDGHEQKVSGYEFGMAYYAYGDPVFAAMAHAGGGDPDLLYGTEELPERAKAIKPYTQSRNAPNVGVVLLRSQTKDRPIEQQIQATLKHGSHGAYHGHYDRCSLGSLMRYGRSFYNPETSWYSYNNPWYKWWVQMSLSHNMVVVDQKMQDPANPTSLLFYSGELIQAAAVETVSRWANPPYMGGENAIERIQQGWERYVPIPDDHPEIAEVTGFTEPVRQRRLLIVTDDYVVIADSVKGEAEHIFDNLLQLRGLRHPDARQAELLGRQAQFDTDPLSSGQFLTNVFNYRYDMPVTLKSEHYFGENKYWETGGLNRYDNTPGVLKLDVHVLWPRQGELVIADYAECHNVAKTTSYEVRADGKALASGVFKPWILGNEEIDVGVSGASDLELIVQAGGKRSLFWGDPRVTAQDGSVRQIGLDAVELNNVAVPDEAGMDYEGGPIRIQGVAYDQALPAEPQDGKAPAVIKLKLEGLNASRFQANFGSDWPVGNEEQLRKMLSVRSRGAEARFLTVIEPFESDGMITRAEASDTNHLHVRLADGREQWLSIEDLDGEGDQVAVAVEEKKDGKLIRRESTRAGE